jgi:hypothetical protein
MLHRVDWWLIADISGQPVSSTACSLKMGSIGCTETAVNNYQSTLRNVPEERIFHLHRGGRLESLVNFQN